ncbi:MAG: replicative DNA helicase [Clostridia bacterium]|nr:replicative DNA helicase [Clostridia bacterium]
MAEGRVPPHNAEAEQSVLGAMLISSDAVADVMAALREEDFYQPAHQAIFDAIRGLYAVGQPVDLVTLCDVMQRHGRLEGAGGAAYIAGLSRGVPATSNLPFYVDIVRDRALLRSLSRAGADISNNANTARQPAREVLDSAEKALFDIAVSREGNQLEQIQPDVFKAYDSIAHAYQNQGQLTGVDTGFIDLNDMLNGFHRSDFIIIGARPSVGKTSLLLNFMTQAALEKGEPVAFFSLEMSREQLVMRMLSMLSGVSQTALRTGRLKDGDFEKLSEAMNRLAPAPIYIDDTASINPADMLSKCRRLKTRQGLSMVMIDYLQLMTGVTRTDNRVAEVSEISRSLKKLARELNVPVLCASQLSRSPDQRKDGHRPLLSDLRESGSIEQDADVVMFIYRDCLYNDDAPRNITEIIVAKQRNGPVGTVKLHWDAERTLFGNLAQDLKPRHDL